MNIPEIAVRKRTSVVVLSLVIIISGLISYYTLPRESAPDITIPFVFIKTDYPGVSPEDIEQSITIPIEKKLKGLEAVKEIKSSSTEGLSSIIIEFVAGTDIDEVLTKTKDKVRNLPIKPLVAGPVGKPCRNFAGVAALPTSIGSDQLPGMPEDSPLDPMADDLCTASAAKTDHKPEVASRTSGTERDGPSQVRQ